MNRRLVFGVIVVALLAVTAGCTLLGGGISDEQLDQDAEYDDLRDRDADVSIDVESGGFLGDGEFRAVYDLDDTAELELYRSNIYRDVPLDVYGVRYWYPNGTEVTGSDLEVEQDRGKTIVRVPDGNGTLAVSGDAGRKSLALPAYVSGSYDVTVPESHRTSNILFGDVTPGGYEREVVDDQERLHWEDNDRDLYLRYYQPSDVTLFVGLVVVVLSLGGVGIAYYYRQVKKLESMREELGLDVDVDDDSDDPPPGLR